MNETYNNQFEFGRKFTEDELDKIYRHLDQEGFMAPSWVLPYRESDGFFKFIHFWYEILFAKGTTEGQIITPPDFIAWDEEKAPTLDEIISLKKTLEKRYNIVNFYTYPKSIKNIDKVAEKEDLKLEYYMMVYAFVRENKEYQNLEKIDDVFALFRSFRVF